MIATIACLGLILAIALGPTLGNWDQKRSQVLHACCIVATCIVLDQLHGWNEVIHFHSHETIPSIAMVLGILPVVVFRFKIIPRSEMALLVYLAVFLPIVSNVFTSLAVLPMIIGVWPFLYKKYGIQRATLIAMVVIMFAANFLAVFTYQADLPTTQYGSDLARNEPYTEGKNPFLILHPIGFACWTVYVIVLFCLGVSIRGKINFTYKIEGVKSLLAVVATCAIFISAMKMNQWPLYLVSPLVAYFIAWRMDAGWKHHCEHLRENVRETGLLFGAIFGLISLMPLSQVAQDYPDMLSFVTAILTLFTDNLIAYVATCDQAFSFGWMNGVKYCLTVSIMFGGHFLLGHAALIIFFLGFLPKEWKRIVDHRSVRNDEEDTGRDFAPENKNYLRFILGMNLRLSLTFLPMTLIMVVGAGNNYAVVAASFVGAVIGGIVIEYIFGKMYPRRESNQSP